MRKIIVLCAFAFVLSLTACTKKEAPATEGATEAAPATSTETATPPPEQETKKEEGSAAGGAHGE